MEHPTEAELMPVATEALLHWSRCKMAATDSCCHKELRETMCVYVTGYSDRPLVVHGQAGSGKTTLVSNFALEVSVDIKQKVNKCSKISLMFSFTAQLLKS